MSDRTKWLCDRGFESDHWDLEEKVIECSITVSLNGFRSLRLHQFSGWLSRCHGEGAQTVIEGDGYCFYADKELVEFNNIPIPFDKIFIGGLKDVGVTVDNLRDLAHAELNVGRAIAPTDYHSPKWKKSAEFLQPSSNPESEWDSQKEVNVSDYLIAFTRDRILRLNHFSGFASHSAKHWKTRLVAEGIVIESTRDSLKLNDIVIPLDKVFSSWGSTTLTVGDLELLAQIQVDQEKRLWTSVTILNSRQSIDFEFSGGHLILSDCIGEISRNITLGKTQLTSKEFTLFATRTSLEFNDVNIPLDMILPPPPIKATLKISDLEAICDKILSTPKEPVPTEPKWDFVFHNNDPVFKFHNGGTLFLEKASGIFSSRVQSSTSRFVVGGIEILAMPYELKVNGVNIPLNDLFKQGRMRVSATLEQLQQYIPAQYRIPSQQPSAIKKFPGIQGILINSELKLPTEGGVYEQECRRCWVYLIFCGGRKFNLSEVDGVVHYNTDTKLLFITTPHFKLRVDDNSMTFDEYRLTADRLFLNGLTTNTGGMFTMYDVAKVDSQPIESRFPPDFKLEFPPPRPKIQLTLKIEEDEEATFAGDECIVCLENARKVMLLPCQHYCLCFGCCETIMQPAHPSSGNCPKCRKEITGAMRPY